jgi:hypothetical protein
MARSISNYFNVSLIGSTFPTWPTSSLNTWQEIPNTNFESLSYNLTFGLYGRIEAWGCLALKTNRSEIWCFGGGHNNTNSNAITRAVLGVDSPYVEMVCQDSPTAQENVRRYPDGKPTSVHGYFNHYYLNTRSEYVVHAPSSYFSNTDGGQAANVLERYNESTGTWYDIADCPSVPAGTTFGASKCKHPTTDDIYSVVVGFLNPALGGRLIRTNASDLTTVTVGSVGPSGTANGGAMDIDPTRSRILRAPDGVSTSWHTIDLATATRTNVTITGPASSITSGNGLRIQYDSIGDRFLLMKTDMTLYAVDANTFVSTTITLSGTPPAAMAGHQDNAIFGKMLFVPALKGFVIWTRHNANGRYVRLYP